MPCMHAGASAAPPTVSSKDAGGRLPLTALPTHTAVVPRSRQLPCCRIFPSGDTTAGTWFDPAPAYNAKSGTTQYPSQIKLQSSCRGVSFVTPSSVTNDSPDPSDYDYKDSTPLVLGNWYTLVLDYLPSASTVRARVLRGRCARLY